MRRKYWLLLLVFAVLQNGSPVLASGDFYVIAGKGAVGTKITSLPYKITKSGFYYLGGDLAHEITDADPRAITVNNSNVTIDLMGFTLSGIPVGSGVGDGIYINGVNVEIRNGTITGFEGNAITVVSYDDSALHRVRNIRAYGNGNGIILGGNSHLVSGCTVSWNVGTGINAYKSSVERNVLRNNLTGIVANDCIIIGNLVIDNPGGNISANNCTLIDNRAP